MPQEPSAPYRPSVPSTPVQDEADEKDKNGTLLTGRAVWNGYLAGCAVFADIDGNLEWNQGEPGVLTTPFGEWSLRAPAGVEVCIWFRVNFKSRMCYFHVNTVFEHYDYCNRFTLCITMCFDLSFRLCWILHHDHPVVTSSLA